MPEKIYSTNNENFDFSALSEAIEDTYTPDEKIGNIVTIYEGEVFFHDASVYLPNILADMEENAYEACGEHVTDWPNLNEDETIEFNDTLNKTVNELFKKFKQTPEFGTVKNIIELKYRITDLEDSDNWELINCSPTKRKQNV